MKEYYNENELKRLNKKTIERAQNIRFRATVQFMLPYVKFYKDLFKEYNVDWDSIKDVEDWRRRGLPLVQKAYFKLNPRDFIVNIPKEKAFNVYHDFFTSLEGLGSVGLWLKALTSKKEVKKELKDYFMPKMPLFSGGTESGKPTPVLITGSQKQNMKRLLHVIRTIIEKEFGKTETIGMNLFPYGPHLAWHAVHEAFDLSGFNLSTAAGGAIPTTRLVHMAEKFQANIFAGMSDYIRNRFLQVAIEQKIKLPKKVLFINGATKMSEAEREKIIELSKRLGAKDAKVLDVFGASEFKEALMPECSPGAGFHNIAPLTNIVKTVTAEEGKKGIITEWNFTAPEKGGYGVVWNIDGAGTLLQGYLIGDIYEKIEHSVCPHCRLNVQKIHNIRRIRDVEAQLKLTGMVEEKIKGARIDLIKIRERLMAVPAIQEAQIIAMKGKLIINIAGNKSKSEAKVKKILSDLEVTPQIRWKALEKLTHERGIKFRPIIVER